MQQQPPPRKVKPTVALKHIHAEQASKLQSKHQQECDLLEDIRTFCSQRSKLEKEYAQGLLKLTGQLLKRDFPTQPDVQSEDGGDYKTVTTVWREILEETEKAAKARLQAAEVYSDKIAEPIKPLRSGKIQCMKKVSPQLTLIQGEVGQSVVEMVKAQKAYNVEETMAHEARGKAGDAEDKLKRKSTGLFQSLASLQKNCAKLKARKETCETKSTAARNEYVLNLVAANAHQIRYYTTDLSDLIKIVDGEVFDKIKEYFTLMGTMSVCAAEQETASFKKVLEETEKISRQYNLQCFLYQNQVFTNLIQYQFEPCKEDVYTKVTGDNGAAPELEKEAKKWANKVAKETKSIRDYQRNLKLIQSGEKLSEGSGDTKDSSSQDPEMKAEELKQAIRKAETAKLKAEARLEALKTAGVNVDEWLTKAQESLVPDEDDIPRTPSQVSIRTESSGGHSMDDHEPTYTHYDDDDDFIDDTFNTTEDATATPNSGRAYPIKCLSLYDFQASNFDELTIATNEEVELIGDGDGEGWVKAKNSLGKTGYIPENYVRPKGDSEEPTTPCNPDPPPPPPLLPEEPPEVSQESPLSGGDANHDNTSSYSSGDLEVQQSTELPLDNIPPPLSEGIWARALYDYEAQTQEELSFLEGALIKVVHKDDNGVDDGFWEGEIDGKTGVFPSLVVEELSVSNLGDELSPLGAGPPDFVPPPPVMVTLPTPEDAPNSPMANGDDTGKNSSEETPTAEQYCKKVRFYNNNHQYQQQQQQQPVSGKGRQQNPYPISISWDPSEDEGEVSIV